MPIFEFKCRNCGQGFERILKTADTPTSCSRCSSTALERLWSRVSAGVPDSPGSRALGPKAGTPQPTGAPSLGLMRLGNASDTTVRRCTFKNSPVGISVSRKAQRYSFEGNKFRNVKKAIVED
jgi:putative FmdB family regulatory protein